MKVIPSPPLVCFLLGLTLPLILGLRCELDCKDDACVETVARVPKKACHQLARSPRWLSRIRPKQHFTVRQKRTFVEITLSRDREPGSVLLLTVPAQGGRRCFNITTPGNQTYSINDGRARTRLKCSGLRITRKGRKIKLYDLTNRKILGSQLVEKRQERLRATQVPPAVGVENESRLPRTACSCVIPDVVYLKPKCVSPGNYTMAVSWAPFYNSSDLRIGIVPEGGSDVFVKNGHRKLPQWKLLTQRLQEDTFTGLELKSGSKYIGLVGSLGCNLCMRYKESEALRVQCPNEGTTPPDPSPAVGMKTTTPTSNSPVLVYAVIGVGTFAFIGVLALGVFMLKVRHGKRYGPLPASDTSASLATVAQVSVIRSSDVIDVVRATESLVSQLQQRGKTTSVLASDVTEVSTSASDLIFHVTSGNDSLPTCLKQLTSKTVTVLHHGNRKPDVVVHRDFQFGDLLNNHMVPGRNLDLDDFLNKLGPAHIDVGPSEVRALLLSCESDENDPHREATKELVKLLREQLAITVVDPQETTKQRLHEQRKMGPNRWAREKLAACNLVIVVPSKDFAGVLTGHTNFTNNNERIVRDVIDYLKQSPPSATPDVCVVTFGYWKEYVESVRMHFPDCRTYNLAETDTDDRCDVETLRHNLRPFFSWLCPDKALVERACGKGEDFLLSADRMSDNVRGIPNVLEDLV